MSAVPRLLVVEDEPGIALALADDLRLEGYEVEVTDNGDMAIRLAQASRFDLMLLDVMLAGRDGFDVCRTLRRKGVTTPIIMLTARTQEAEKVLALESGADDYVTKPFGPRELRARIAAVIRRARQEPAGDESRPNVRIGDVEVDFERAEVRRGDDRTPLTPLEYKLLQTFIAANGRILSRDQLIAAAWGPGTFVTDRVVDNHIGSLRRKLEPDAAEPRYLLNIRGLGYRLDCDAGKPRS
jgi:DNA-binding response OmpR family regulator